MEKGAEEPSIVEAWTHWINQEFGSPMLRADDSAGYTAAIRAQLVSQGGHLQRGYRDVYDRRGVDPFESKCSLWSKATQKAMSETKRRRAAHRAMLAARMAEEAEAVKAGA